MPDPASSSAPDAPRTPITARLVKLVAWALESFGPLLAFWLVLRIAGLVPAIVTGISVGAVLVARTVVRERRVSPFTAFTAASVVLFGMLDLHYRSGFFVKLEPALGNVVSGVFFLGSVLWGAPVIIEIAERSVGRPLAHARRYLTLWTVAWGIFFFLRAAAFVWMAFHLSLERDMEIRATVGPLSFGGMFVIEFGTRRIFARMRARAEAAAAPAEATEKRAA